ncbi:response regulator transcription factor [Halomonas binhaiensis]|uniref:Response regulator transcription factor n=1 Tax=Halomonas binhaiensis TaxID=2562282 RepID=A0A5C1ND63_9GAMM|nr:response regulator transcription factor [Halomonas binhaiensis]QEM80408.1 response regulator transcription factor [Halomonas binhaiensis]
MLDKPGARVVVVDDHPMIRLAVSFSLDNHGIKVVGESDNGADAIQLIKVQKPDLAILDIGIHGLDGLAVIRRIQALDNPSRVLVLTSYPPEIYAMRSYLAGASGFVSKDKDMSILVSGVKTIIGGYTFFPSLSSDPSDAPCNSECDLIKLLSNRELMVFNKLLKGMSNKEISQSMLLSNKTISTYKVRIFDKLGVSNMIELYDLARRLDVLDGL